ncbi:MAG: ATP-binding protein [Ignavibacteriales bacterium]|nr:ATP-binding protein [Ignavibacteriales bacterium]
MSNFYKSIFYNKSIRNFLVSLGAMLILFLDLLLFNTSFPQNNEYEISRISIEQGLSQSSVYSILQDRHNFMWFGTAEGLNKYDGYKFYTYKFDRYDSSSISDNWILALREDKSGTIWIGTNGGGLNKFDDKTEKFIHFKYDINNPKSLSDNVVNTILEDKNGVLWIGTDNGLNKFDKVSKTFFSYKNDPSNSNSISNNYVNTIFEDSQSNLWVGTNDGGLNKFDRAKGIFYQFKNDPKNSNSISNDRIWAIQEDPNNKNILWVATYGGLNKFDVENGIFYNLKHDNTNPNSLIGNSIRSFKIDSKGNFWIGTNGDGLDKYQAKKNMFYHFLYDRNEKNSISKNNIVSIYEDKSGLIWIGTRSGGLNKIKKYKFRKYAFSTFSIEDINTNNIWSIFKDDEKNVWIGTDNGLLVFNRASGKCITYKNNPRDSKTISDNVITAIFEDKNKTIWIGTESGGLNKFDKQSGSFISFKHNPNNPFSITDDYVKTICEDKQGVLWIGTRGGGISAFDRTKSIFKNYRNTNSNNSLSHNRVNYIFEDQSGQLWICTSGGGLNKFNRKTETFTHFTFDPANPNSLSDIYALSCNEDKAGNLWVCTYDGGLNKFDKTTGKFIHFNMKNGLPGNVVYGVLEDSVGNLWISTNNGLSKFNPQAQSFMNYDNRDGLQGTEYNSGSFYKSKDGEMFFGGINGFNSFFPNEIKDNQFSPPIVITAFRKFDQLVTFNEPISEMDKINLSYKENYFSFEFASLDYSSPEKNQYAYMMEGFDKDWIKCGSRRYVSYTNLRAGEYTFKVKGTNSDGLWNDKPAEIKIIISPPYWNTWWFRISIVVLIIGLIYFFYKKRIKYFETHTQILQKEIVERLKVEEELTKAKEKAEESDRLKSNFLAQMSHEIRTPINTILSFTSLLKDETENKISLDLQPSFGIIEQGGRRLIRTIDMILNMSEIQAGRFDIQLRKLNIVDDILSDIVSEFRFIASGKKLQLSLDCNAENKNIIGDRYSVLQIFQNLIDNSLKYTESGSVTISVYNQTNKLINVDVKDTGIGISEEYLSELFIPFSQEDSGYTRRFEGTGLGLSLVENYLKLNNAGISVQSEKGKGSIFTVSFKTA